MSFFILATTALPAAAIQAPDPAAVDSIFAAWNGTDSPGCVCAVSDNRGILFERGYGMANLELDIPLRPNSVFYAASVSKQFVAASVALLALRGEVSLAADARELLPQLSGMPQPITVRDLAQHTSGVRDYFSLHRLAGHHPLDHMDNESVLRLLSLQRSLEFDPDAAYAYSNSNYVLLAELVRRVTGSTLREFTRRELFGPLGMTDTGFEDDHHSVVPRRVSSYEDADGSYRRFVKEFDVVGDGGLLSTARDLTAWGRNLLRPTVGGPALVELLSEPATLADGTSLDYALGLRLDEVSGVPTIGHTGSFKGFRTRLLVLPDEKLVIVVLCNAAGADASRLSEAVADAWLGVRKVADVAGTPGEDAAPSPGPTEGNEAGIRLSDAQLDAWAGHYWSDGEALARHIYVRDGTLFYGRGGRDSRLVAVEEARFTMPGFGIPITFDFFREDDGTRAVTMRIADFQTIEYREYEPADPDQMDLRSYVGPYASDELATTYRVLPVEDGLSLEAGRPHISGPLVPIMGELFQATIDGETYTLRFERSEGLVRGFRLDSGLSHGLWFARAPVWN